MTLQKWILIYLSTGKDWHQRLWNPNFQDDEPSRNGKVSETSGREHAENWVLLQTNGGCVYQVEERKVGGGRPAENRAGKHKEAQATDWRYREGKGKLGENYWIV